MSTVDLSCDLGEASDAHGLGIERAIWPLITTANIACGGHAGDEVSMTECVELALRHGVAVGAHPSYPDRDGFGRRSLEITAAALEESLREQLRALRRIAERAGAILTHAKPHGALYNDAHRNRDIAGVIARVCSSEGLAIITSPGSAVESEARAARARVIREGFADRRYRADGSLTPRSEPGALLIDADESAAQAVALARGDALASSDGPPLHVPCETICIHSDTPGAPARLRHIRAALERHGFTFGRTAS